MQYNSKNSLSASIYLVIENKPKGFLVWRSFDEDKENDGHYSEEFYYLLHIDVTGFEDIPTLLAKHLNNYGLILNSIRELARITKINPDFTDNSPATTKEEICFHANVDITNRFPKDINDHNFISFESLNNIPDLIHSTDVIWYGLKKMQYEK